MINIGVDYFTVHIMFSESLAVADVWIRFKIQWWSAGFWTVMLYEVK